MGSADQVERLRAAWVGRASGCQLGKAVEMFSMQEGQPALAAYLEEAKALPLRDYIPHVEGSAIDRYPWVSCCHGKFDAIAPDDDIHYSTLALIMLEKHGLDLSTEDVARTWLNLLPVGMTFTAERAAYRILLERGHEWFAQGADPGFDVTECADNPFNDWIGAQIRADVYGWVCPGRPDVAAELVRRDAALSHRDDGIHGAVFVAAMGALLWEAEDMNKAIAEAAGFIPADSRSAEAIELALQVVGEGGDQKIRDYYEGMSPVHVLNNLALVVWALATHARDFSAAIGDVTAAGLDTDCNAATVGGLLGLWHGEVPDHWLKPWNGRIELALAGHDKVDLDDLVQRTSAVTDSLRTALAA